MKFAQIIEFTTSRIDAFNAELAVLNRDRDAENVYLLMVEFASHEQGMENSSRPETGEFAAFLNSIADGPLTFRNLDVVRVEHL